VRGLGIRRLDHEPMAVVGLVVDLAAEDAERLPAASETVLLGVPLRRLAVAPGADALVPVLALLHSPDGDIKLRHDPCSRARWHKSNRRAISSPPQGAGKAPFTAMQHHSQIAGKPLAHGLRMVMMGGLSCGATGTRRRGAP